jgi:hypothetical protein
MTAKATIITVNTPQPAIMKLVLQPDKIEKFVDLRLSMEEAEVIRWLSGTELASPITGKYSLMSLYSVLGGAGVKDAKSYKGLLPTRCRDNSGAWYWGLK